jgi:DNA-directed RNA polymerase specialized sigma24 family protein
MKKLLVVAVLAGAGWLGYQYVQTGSLPFGSQAPASAEEAELDALFDQFESARAEFRQALKSAGLTGMDTSSAADAAVQQIGRVEKALNRLKRKLQSDEARKKAEKLEQAIKLFQSKLR